MNKKKFLSLLIAISLITPLTVTVQPVNTYAAKETAEEAEARKLEALSEENRIDENGNFTTGSQINYLENETNPDEDIEEEVKSLIPLERESVTISSVADFETFARNCRLDTWSANKEINLTCDLSLAGSDLLTVPFFNGTFNGNGHTISGYEMRDKQSEIGLFSILGEDAIVKDLKLTATIIPDGKSSIIGGLAGRNNGTIINCSFDGTITANDYIGGLVGINELTGIVADSSVSGYISGEHFTGGIAGENMGNILRSSNVARINTDEKEVSYSIEELNVSKTINLFNIGGSDSSSESESTAMVNGIVDTGGIAGLSVGVIQSCENNGLIGYERLGYNVGGITGRQSGYIYDCKNNGIINGRKDVGGITGQGEPYVTVDFAQDTVRQLSDNISKLHDIIEVTLNDADNQSDTISNRLSVIQSFTNQALDDTSYLSDSTVTFIDGVTESANKALDKVEYIMSEASKDGGVFDQANSAIDNLKTAGEIVDYAINDLDIYNYLTDDEAKRLDNARDRLKKDSENLKVYAKNAEEAAKASDYTIEGVTNALDAYYTDKARNDVATCTDGTYTNDQINAAKAMKPVCKRNDGTKYVNLGWSYEPIAEDNYDAIYKKYNMVTGWVHTDKTNEGNDWPTTQDKVDSQDSYLSYPNTSVTTGTGADTRLVYAEEESAVASKKATYSRDSATKAQDMYNSLSSSYDKDGTIAAVTSALGNTAEIAELLLDASEEMKDNEADYADAAYEYLQRAANDLKNVSSGTKNILSNASNMPKATMPSLGEEYRRHTQSLNNNLKGMSDNFGYLNTEMNGATDVIIGDLSAVNDQFNTIMMLYTDAIDGVLDRDYSNTIEDDSTLVAKTCKDATIDSCVNNGVVEGSINVSGICGTLAIEYDYDLESDVTGIKESNMNTTYLTKCVLRNDINRATITGQKDGIGGVCGLQEMGTIIWCQNYGKIESTAGDYIGGIAGQSISDIIESYAKCILSGRSYIGGIVGSGADISKSVAIPSVLEKSSYFGAIAGDVTSDGIVRSNYFVSEELAGINRVSYSRKAEPISYTELMTMEGIPSDFAKMNVYFILDEDEDEDTEDLINIGYTTVNYGSPVTRDMYVDIPNRQGFYVTWDKDGVDSVTSDVEITANYKRLRTTLASNTPLSNGQSAVLVDGQFKDGDVFEASKNLMPNGALENSIEYWELTIPEDNQIAHQVRYMLGDKYRDELGEDIEIYALNGSDWKKVEEPGKMGAYYTFELTGFTPKFQVVNVHKPLDIKKIAIIAGSALAVIIIIIIIIIIVRRGKGNGPKGSKKSSNSRTAARTHSESAHQTGEDKSANANSFDVSDLENLGWNTGEYDDLDIDDDFDSLGFVY